jgi:ribosomal protein S18 acetylase RimI-like enzyme
MMESQITLRDATPEDKQFLLFLYRDTRRREMNAWGWPPEQQESFLRMQFDAQCRSYRAAFPNASDSIVCLEGHAIGRILVGQDSSGKRLIDIALLEEYRNRGIGSHLLRQMLQECELQGRALHLQALQGNPAIRLYQRLGFLQSSADPMYAQLQWPPSGHGERF